jgi:hypothetical protein
MTQNTNDKNGVEKSLEDEVFLSLKSYGYLFPETPKEVERYEELYGTTEIDVPLDFEPRLPADLSYPNLDLTGVFTIAAFSSGNKSSIKLPEEE